LGKPQKFYYRPNPKKALPMEYHKAKNFIINPDNPIDSP